MLSRFSNRNARSEPISEANKNLLKPESSERGKNDVDIALSSAKSHLPRTTSPIITQFMPDTSCISRKPKHSTAGGGGDNFSTLPASFSSVSGVRTVAGGVLNPAGFAMADAMGFHNRTSSVDSPNSPLHPIANAPLHVHSPPNPPPVSQHQHNNNTHSKNNNFITGREKSPDKEKRIAFQEGGGVGVLMGGGVRNRLWKGCCFLLCCSFGETPLSLSQRWFRFTFRIFILRATRLIMAFFIAYTILTQRRLFLSVPLQMAGQCPFGAVLERSDMGKLYKSAEGKPASNNSKAEAFGVGPATGGSLVTPWGVARPDALSPAHVERLVSNGIRIASMQALQTPHLRLLSTAASRHASDAVPRKRWSQYKLEVSEDVHQRLREEIQQHKSRSDADRPADFSPDSAHFTLVMELGAVSQFAAPFPLHARRVAYTLAKDSLTSSLCSLLTSHSNTDSADDSNATTRKVDASDFGAEGVLEVDKLLVRGSTQPQMIGGSTLGGEANASDVGMEFLFDVDHGEDKRLAAYLQQREKALWWRSVRSHHVKEISDSALRVERLRERRRREQRGGGAGGLFAVGVAGLEMRGDDDDMAPFPMRYSFADLVNAEHILSPRVWKRHESLRFHSKMPFEVVDPTGVPVYEKYLRNADEAFVITDDTVNVMGIALPNASFLRVEDEGTIAALRHRFNNCSSMEESLQLLESYGFDVRDMIPLERVGGGGDAVAAGDETQVPATVLRTLPPLQVAVKVNWFRGQPFHDPTKNLNPPSFDDGEDGNGNGSPTEKSKIKKADDQKGAKHGEEGVLNVFGRWLGDWGKAVKNFHGLRYLVRSEVEEEEIKRADATVRGKLAPAPTSVLRHATISSGYTDDTSRGDKGLGGWGMLGAARSMGASAVSNWKSLAPIPNLPITMFFGKTNEDANILEREQREASLVEDVSDSSVPTLLESTLRGGDTRSVPTNNPIRLAVIKRLARSSYVIPIQQRQIPLVIMQTNQNTLVPEGIKIATERLLKDNPEFSYEFFSDHAMDAFVSMYFDDGPSVNTADEVEDDSEAQKHQRARVLEASVSQSLPKQSKSKRRSLIAEAYFSLIPGAFRADLFRYLYLFLFGGVYIDMGMSPPTAESYAPYAAYRGMCERHHENARIHRLFARDFLKRDDAQRNNKFGLRRRGTAFLSNPQTFCPGPLFSMLRPDDTFVSAEDSGEGLVYNAFMMAAPAHPILKTAITMSVNKILARYWVMQTKHNNAALSVTGPKLLAEAFKEVTRRSPEPNKNYGKGVRLVSYWRFNACLSGAIEGEVDVRAEVMHYENRDLLEYRGLVKRRDEAANKKKRQHINSDVSPSTHSMSSSLSLLETLNPSIPESLDPDVHRTRTLLFTKYDTYYYDSRHYHINAHYGILYGKRKIYRERGE